VLVILAGALLASAQQPSGELPDLGNTGVVVPWEDFKKILEEIRKPPPTPVVPPPPVDFALSECAATATISGDEAQLRVALDFQVQVLNDQRWVEVPVIADGVALSSVLLDGRPARMYRSRNAHTVALRGAGQHRIALEYMVPVQDQRGTRTARLRFPPTPGVAIDLSVPRGDVDVQVDGAVVEEISRSRQQTRVRAALARVGDTAVSWFPRVEADDKGPKVFGELATLISIGEGVLRGSSTASFTIHGRGVDRFRLEIPADITVLGVNVHGLREWQVVDVEGADDRRLLEVELNYLATGGLGFSFDFEQPLGGTSVELELPDIAIRDVLRERGFLAVAAATNVEISPREGLQNAAPVDPSELPAALVAGNGETILYGFKFLRHPVVVPLEVVKHRDVAVKRTIVESARLHTFLNRDGKLVTSARYSVKNNRKQYLELELPEDATLWGAYLEERPVKAARREDGTILVPLKKTAMGAGGELRPFVVEVVYFEQDRGLRAVGRRPFAAPAIDVDVLELHWDLYLPRERCYVGFRGNVEEDPSANRIAVIGGAVYNIANADETLKLGIIRRDGRSYLTDGANEALIESVRVQAAGKQRSLTPEELARVGGRGDLDPGEDVEDKRAGEPMREALPSTGRAERDRGAPQVEQNVPDQFAQLRVAPGGRALGVLPVRIPIPSEGIRLSFVGRLITASEPPWLSVRYAPAGWSLPELGRTWTIVLTFGLGMMLLFLIGFGFRGMPAVRWTALIATAAALVAVFSASADHRLAFTLAAVAAVAGFWLAIQLRERSDVEEGF
jgi:hypothetical protein